MTTILIGHALEALRRRAFVAEMVRNPAGDAIEAARRAGYAEGAEDAAHRLLTSPAVSALIDAGRVPDEEWAANQAARWTRARDQRRRAA